MQQQVTVKASTPTLDATSTAIAVPFDAHVLAYLPNSRSMFGILAATTGVHVDRFEVGGNRAYAGVGTKRYGTSGRNRPMVEGINVGGIFATGLPLDYGSFEEVAVRPPRTAPSGKPGVSLHFVVKSGGNQYHGTLYADYENETGSHSTSTRQVGRGSARRRPRCRAIRIACAITTTSMPTSAATSNPTGSGGILVPRSGRRRNG